MSKDYFGFNSTQEHTLRGLDLAVTGSVDTSALAAGSVTTAKIAAAAVTGPKLGAITSAELKTALTDETGSGVAVFATSPTLVTPALGTPSALVLTNATGLPNTATALLNIAPTAYAADGAIGPTVRMAVLSKAGVGAYTLAAGTDGAVLEIINTTANAHVVTATGLINDGVTGGSKNTLTFGAFAGACIRLVSYGSKWNVISKNVVTIA
jgi:hypothetical protein